MTLVTTPTAVSQTLEQMPLPLGLFSRNWSAAVVTCESRCAVVLLLQRRVVTSGSVKRLLRMAHRLPTPSQLLSYSGRRTY